MSALYNSKEEGRRSQTTLSLQAIRRHWTYLRRAMHLVARLKARESLVRSLVPYSRCPPPPPLSTLPLPCCEADMFHPFSLVHRIVYTYGNRQRARRMRLARYKAIELAMGRAVPFQTAWRGFVARRKLRLLRERKQAEWHAAVLLQRAWYR